MSRPAGRRAGRPCCRVVGFQGKEFARLQVGGQAPPRRREGIPEAAPCTVPPHRHHDVSLHAHCCLNYHVNAPPFGTPFSTGPVLPRLTA